jgi:hypothetical protein
MTTPLSVEDEGYQYDSQVSQIYTIASKPIDVVLFRLLSSYRTEVMRQSC